MDRSGPVVSKNAPPSPHNSFHIKESPLGSATAFKGEGDMHKLIKIVQERQTFKPYQI